MPSDEADFSAYWKADIVSEGFREVLSDGPHWSGQAYFDESYTSKRYGPLDPSRMQLRFNPRQKRPKADFPWATGLLTCAQETFDAIFCDLLDGFVKTFAFRIDGIPYLSFRPTTFLDLLDLDTSEFLRDDGVKEEPLGFRAYAFSWIGLKAAPAPPVPIFSCSVPGAARYYPIVAEEFVRRYEQSKLTGLRFRKAWPLADT
jgi:hypothetical protein